MRQNKGVTIAALVIAIVGLSIGFAAFSNTLTIRSSASVTPDDSNFSVVFSTNASTLQTNPVTATNSTYGDPGTINNRPGNPTLTGLHAKFTEPGQSVVYNLYVLNNGLYDAYLTNIEFTEVETGKVVKCTSGTGASDTLTQLACQDISIKLELGTSPNNQEFTPATDGALQTPRLLSKNTSEPVKVTITYADNGRYVDGPVEVSFGDILLLYRSVGTSVASIPVPVEEDDSCTVTNVKSFGACTYTDDDTSGGISTGDKVTCGTESFYVIENPSNETVKMLTEWNLNVSEPGNMEGAPIEIPYSYTYCESTVGYQDSHVRGYLEDQNSENLFTLTVEYQGQTMSRPWPYGTVKFDRVTTGDYGYWTTGDNHQLDTSKYVGCSGECNYSSSSSVGGYPAYVYDNNATLKTFVDTYVGYLNSAISGTNAQGRLIRYEELTDLGCSNSSCSSAPSWVYQTSYWSGSADVGSRLYGVYSDGGIVRYEFGNDSNFGVRPVIEISSGVISLAS